MQLLTERSVRVASYVAPGGAASNPLGWRRGTHTLYLALALLAGVPAVTVAQEFLPPETAAESPAVWLGLAGFGTRLGLDVSAGRQGVVGFTIDAGNLGSPRVRLRPSLEVGFAGDAYNYVGNLEVLYRFTADTERAIPYVGGGLGVYGQEACGATEGCPGLWVQFVLGFELRLNDRVNWLMEYHPEDFFSRNVLLVGLTMRRGG